MKGRLLGQVASSDGIGDSCCRAPYVIGVLLVIKPDDDRSLVGTLLGDALRQLVADMPNGLMRMSSNQHLNGSIDLQQPRGHCFKQPRLSGPWGALQRVERLRLPNRC